MRSIVVILDNIRSALNVGAILRTCDGAGVEKVLLCGITPNITHYKVSKTALGAEFKVEVVQCPDTVQAAKELEKQGYSIYVIEQSPTAKQLQQLELPEKIAFIFGHEATGVQPKVLENLPQHIELPMLGHKNSLNVATTVGIVLYFVRLNEI
jgi:23S rRNA (guanosine2251-2'-O)-methyltransferase